jgi:transcriptional regulator with XRE-family HTH domain
MNKNAKSVQNFSSRLRAARQQAGLTQYGLAKKLGLKGNTPVYRFESGISSPSIKTLCRIAEVLKSDLHLLVTGEPSPTAIRLVDSLAPQISDYFKELQAERSQLSSQLVGLQLSQTLKGEDNKAQIEQLEEEIVKIDDEQQSISRILGEVFGRKTNNSEGGQRPIIKSSKK